MSLISVIIPAFNAETSILIAISSVLRQTYKNFEIIVIDDGSSDKTSDIVKSCGEKVIYSYQKKKGVAEARNRGIDMAKGEYIMFLDADDYFEPVIMKHLLTIDSKGDSDFVVGNMYLENLKKQRVINYNFKKSEKIELKKKEDWEAAFKIVGNSTAGKLFKRTIIGNTRFPIFGIGEDALFMLEVMLKINMYLSM